MPFGAHGTMCSAPFMRLTYKNSCDPLWSTSATETLRNSHPGVHPGVPVRGGPRLLCRWTPGSERPAPRHGAMDLEWNGDADTEKSEEEEEGLPTAPESLLPFSLYTEVRVGAFECC